MYYFFLYFYLVSSKEMRTFIYKLQYIWLREIHLEVKFQLILRVMYTFSMGKWTVIQGPLMVMEVVLCNRSHFYIRTIKPVSSITKGICALGSVNTQRYRSRKQTHMPYEIYILQLELTIVWTSGTDRLLFSSSKKEWKLQYMSNS